MLWKINAHPQGSRSDLIAILRKLIHGEKLKLIHFKKLLNLTFRGS